jgi:hypothetical protein
MSDKKRELDAWIAERVMGWQWWRFRAKKKSGKGYDRWQQMIPPTEKWHLNPKYNAIRQTQGKGRYIEDYTDISTFTPTTSYADALKVLEKCKDACISRGHAIVIHGHGNGNGPMVSDMIITASGFEMFASAQAQTLPMAICRFAKALFE